ncbi:hypothetical protein MTO96_012884 [Rhipicephalus appendiculatus]
MRHTFCRVSAVTRPVLSVVSGRRASRLLATSGTQRERQRADGGDDDDRSAALMDAPPADTAPVLASDTAAVAGQAARTLGLAAAQGSRADHPSGAPAPEPAQRWTGGTAHF